MAEQPTILDAIIAGVLEDTARREAAVPFEDIKAQALSAPEPLDALAALSSSDSSTVSVIAEVKRASPSKD